MNIGFVMYNWESVKPKLDTTLRLKRVFTRGHSNCHLSMKWQSDELKSGHILTLFLPKSGN